MALWAVQPRPRLCRGQSKSASATRRVPGCQGLRADTNGSPMTVDPVLVRNVAPGDTNFVYSTWLRDLRDSDASALPDDLWFAAHRAYLDRVFLDPTVRVLVAAAADQPNEILGYIVAQPNEVLQWVYVRKGLRGQGLAKRLLNEVKAPPGTPAAWMTPLGRQRLQNPRRSRQIRRAASSTAKPSKASGSFSIVPAT